MPSIALRSRQNGFFLLAKNEEATRCIQVLHIDRKCKKKMSKTRTKNAIIWSRNSVAAEAVAAKHMINKSLWIKMYAEVLFNNKNVNQFNFYSGSQLECTYSPCAEHCLVWIVEFGANSVNACIGFCCAPKTSFNSPASACKVKCKNSQRARFFVQIRKVAKKNGFRWEKTGYSALSSE